MNWKEAVNHPLTIVSAGLAFAFEGMHMLQLLAEFAAATVNLWYPILGMLSMLAGNIAFIPAAVIEPLLLVGALVYGAVMLGSLADKARNFIKRNS